MFGFSIQKLLFTAIAIAAVWYAFKWLGRVQAQKRELDRREAKRMDETQTSKGRAPEIEDMVECPHCGAFVPADGSHRCDELDRG